MMKTFVFAFALTLPLKIKKNDWRQRRQIEDSIDF
jgi:hypothetical protein